MSCLTAPPRPGSAVLPCAPRTGLHHAGAIAAALIALTKPRLAFASVLTALVAYVVVVPAVASWHAVLTLVGTIFSAGGALSFNQWWERRTDALMRRTSGRPLPCGVISPAIALGWSLALSTSGVVVLATWIDGTAAMLALAIIVLYGLVYTPLKRRTRWATEVGSLSGALPPLLGAAAGGDAAAPAGLLLAGILLFWQMPHFFAIGWLHRDDYRAAGFPLLPAIDPTGRRTAGWALGHTAALLLASPLLGAVAGAGVLYFGFAVCGGATFLWLAWVFLRASAAARDHAARRLFLASVFYLPALLAVVLLEWKARA